MILGVLATGVCLAVLAWPITATHWIKLGAALLAVSANLLCVYLVVRRKTRLDQGASEAESWHVTRRIVLCAVAGLPFAATAAGLGFFLAYQRLLASSR